MKFIELFIIVVYYNIFKANMERIRRS